MCYLHTSNTIDEDAFKIREKEALVNLKEYHRSYLVNGKPWEGSMRIPTKQIAQITNKKRHG